MPAFPSPKAEFGLPKVVTVMCCFSDKKQQPRVKIATAEEEKKQGAGSKQVVWGWGAGPGWEGHQKQFAPGQVAGGSCYSSQARQ